MLYLNDDMTDELSKNLPAPRLLVVEDDSDYAHVLSRALEAQYQVVCADSGEEALSLLTKHPFDLVLLDVMMWKINGLQVLKAIREVSEPVDLPVILLSARASNKDIAQGLDAGANDYITKPCDLEVLQARIRRQLEIKRTLDERQRTINHLKANQESKDQLMFIATHDIKNPLNNIRLAHFYLRNSIGDDPYAIDALDTIEETLNSINELVEDFLDSAVLQNGKAELELEPVEIEPLIWSAISQYGASANRKNVTLLMDNTDGVVIADRSRLVQVLSNLVSNAVKYSPRNRMVNVFTDKRGDRVRVSVSDEGPGIREDERHKLFKAFGKLSNKPTGGESSTGLGLWIVKELVELQGGIVGVDCPPGGGSIFWVELPAYIPNDEAM
jgi:two-component system sensor histidine kinase/response regulator